MYENDVWIAEQFGAADLGDARRSRRAAQLALSLLRAPGVGLPEQTKTWGGCKAAYRLLHCPEVTRIKLMQPHFDMTLASANKPGVTLFAQDTTELDYTHMVHAQGYGPIGNHKGAGLMVHSLLALTPQGEILGLAAQHSWARSNGPTHKNNETSAQRRLRDGKESEVWPKLLESVGAVPPSKVWVSIGDRGSDSFDYWRRATALGWQCLSRIFTNRRTADNSHLITKARALPLQGQIVVHQRARPGQAARSLYLNLAWSAEQVLPPRNDASRAKDPALDVNVVRCWDDNHGVEWLLLFTGDVNSFDDAAQCVRWYEQRWTIEEFHKCLKSGCHIEQSQIKKASAVDVLLGFCSVVAVRLLALARLARMCPQAPAIQHIEEHHLTVLCSIRKLDPKVLTVRDYWRELAKMGGFLGRNSDKNPGWKSLWSGLMKLEAWIVAWKDGFAQGQKCG